MSMTFKEMQEMYNGIVKRFSKIELQDWKAEGVQRENPSAGFPIGARSPLLAHDFACKV